MNDLSSVLKVPLKSTSENCDIAILLTILDKQELLNRMVCLFPVYCLYNNVFLSHKVAIIKFFCANKNTRPKRNV